MARRKPEPAAAPARAAAPVDARTSAAATSAAVLPDWAALSPLAQWRDWVVKSEAQWSESLGQALQDPATAGLLGRQIDEMRMAHRLFGEVAEASLAAAHLPSRADVEGLEDRLGRLEDALAQLSASVLQLRASLVLQGAATAPARPPRNRRPASAPAAAPAAAAPARRR